MNKPHLWIDQYTTAFVAAVSRHMKWAERTGRTEGEHHVLLFAPWVLVGFAGWAGPWWTDAILAAAIGVPILYSVGKALTLRL